MFIFYYINLILLIILIIPGAIEDAEEEKNEDKDNPRPKYTNKTLELLEKIGRYGTMLFYVVKYEEERTNNIISYLVPALFLAVYLLLSFFTKKNKCLKRTLTLTVIEMLMFLSSALIDKNYLLLAFLIIFAPSAIIIDTEASKFDKKHSKQFDIL